MYRKKRAFSLLEILIALALASILFGCIFSNFYQTYKLRHKIEKLHATTINRQIFYLHLDKLLAELPLIRKQQRDQDLGQETKDLPPGTLYTDSLHGSLALCFCLPCDYAEDQKFIGLLTYCLYLDERNHILQFLIKNAEGDELTETIMHKIKSYTIALFDSESMTWVNTWPKDKKYQPAFLKLEIIELQDKKSGPPIEFLFALPPSRQAMVFTS